MKSVAIVMGTYNRLACLQRAIASIRAAVGAHPYRIIIIDGGSSDGTHEYLLHPCWDVDLTIQRGPLTGAVRAFNLGFGAAVSQKFDYVMHLNDDAEIMTASTDPDYSCAHPIAAAIEVMEDNPKIGEVAFAFDLRGSYGFDRINDVPYANFGIVRLEAGMAVAREQGDPSGYNWWNPIYRTYGADSEFGANLWKLGWHIYCAHSLRVHDVNHQDALRAGNTTNNKNGDAELFWSRWRNVDLLKYAPRQVRYRMGVDKPNKLPTRRIRREPKLNPEYKK